jgi:hypothetical protein
LSSQEDRVEYTASKPRSRSTRIKSRVSKGGRYGNTKRRLFTNTTRVEKRVETISIGRVDRSEDFIDQTVATVGQDEADSDTIVVDCGEGIEEQLSARMRNNMRKPTARQIHKQLDKKSQNKNGHAK